MQLKRIRNRGALLLGVLVIILAIVVIGLVAYAIFRALSRWKPRQINPDDVAQWKQAAASEMQTNLPATGILSDGTYFVQLREPTIELPQVRIQRSTNLIDWETVATLSPQDAALWSDPEQPWPQAFYRIIQ